MYSKTPTGKNTKGTPSLESYQGRLRIRFRVNGQQKAFSLGLADTSENRVKGESIASQMHFDMLSGNFDSTLGKYKPLNHLTVVESIKPKEPKALSTIDLWQQFSKYKFPRLATCTKSKYQSVASLLERYDKDINNEEDVQDYIEYERKLGNSEQTIKDRLVLLKACGNWAFKKGLIQKNPFWESLELIKPKTRERLNPFNSEEVQKIIIATENSKYYSHYTSFITFLFLTGCRTSEAIGLQWKHVSENFKSIYFYESLTRGERKNTKTNKNRYFPCNKNLELFLKSIKPANALPDDLIFPSPKGTSIDDHNFSQRAWKAILEDANVKHRKPYNTRHTFCSHCADAGMSAVEIAELVGNSPEVVLNRYTGVINKKEVPELY